MALFSNHALLARRSLPLFAAVIVLACARAAMANAVIAMAVEFPATVTAGMTGNAADLDFRNVSTPASLTIAVDSIRLTPSCAKYTASVCTSVDNGVFAVAASGSGRTGTACAGVAFTFAPHAGATDGTLDVTPSAPVTLGTPGAPNGGDRCTIDFTFDVLKYPAKDAQATVTGRQTSPGAVVNGTASDATAAVVFASTFVTVQQATPSLATAASADIVAGGALSDSATLAGGASPTGKITFRLYGPNDDACDGTVVFTKVVTIAGNGTYASGPFTPAAAGTYRWVASYAGDASNLATSGACNDAGESAVVAFANPTLTTVASAAIKLGGTITDSATLALGAKPTGTITYALYGPDDAACASAIFTTAKLVNGNAKYVSAAFAPTQPGTYRWIAAYGGNAANTPVAGACGDAGESVVVAPATPTIATTASAGGALGIGVTDSATLAAGFAPAGTLTFVLYAVNDATCATPLFTPDAITVNGNGAYASTPVFVPPAVGTYRWRAFYSGDANNAPISGACGAARESVTIAKITPTLSTVSTAGGTLGTAVGDQATIAGGAAPTGTLRFRLYGPDDVTCANAARFTSALVNVNGNGTYASTPAFTPAAAGTYRWRASYSGDASNAAVTGPCNDTAENVTIAQTVPLMATAASAGGAIGTTLTDKATLTGGTAPTGAVTFVLYGPGDATCGAAPVFTSAAITVNGNGTYMSAPAFAAGAAGVYRWRALYAGDANNAAVAGACNDPGESATIDAVTPTLVTAASAGGVIGVPLFDQATLGGGLLPGGAIAFSLYGPNDATCANAPVFTASVAVNGNAVYASSPYAPLAVGTYRWIAAYGGDANNANVSGLCGDSGETAVVGAAVPALATTASAGGAIGAMLNDQATLTGGFAPTGTLTFSLYSANDATCAGPPVFTSVVAVAGDGVYVSTPFAPASAGTYRWRAFYSGDARNAPVAGTCNDAGESAVMTKAAPSLATSASPAIALGGAISDGGVLAAGVNPGGTLTFRLYSPADATCAGTPLFSSVVNVAGNGSYASAAFTPPAVGTWRWIASYGGDANNTAVAGACGAPGESVVVSLAVPTIATTASAGGALGVALTDHATLAGGVNPGGTLAFSLFGPDDATCAAAPAFTSTVAVGGNGMYALPFTPALAGTYRWRASYSGDAGNAPVAGACNDTGESATVASAMPTLAASSVPASAIPVGAPVHDMATLGGGDTPSFIEVRDGAVDIALAPQRKAAMVQHDRQLVRLDLSGLDPAGAGGDRVLAGLLGAIGRIIGRGEPGNHHEDCKGQRGDGEPPKPRRIHPSTPSRQQYRQKPSIAINGTTPGRGSWYQKWRFSGSQTCGPQDRRQRTRSISPGASGIRSSLEMHFGGCDNKCHHIRPSSPQAESGDLLAARWCPERPGTAC